MDEVEKEHTAADVIRAYKSLDENEQARFWVLMEKHRHKAVTSKASIPPPVPEDVAKRMKEVIPPKTFAGDITHTVRTKCELGSNHQARHLVSTKSKVFEHGLKFLDEDKKVMFTTFHCKKSKRTGRPKRSKKQLTVDPTARVIIATGKKDMTLELSRLHEISVKKGRVVLKVATFERFSNIRKFGENKEKYAFAFKNGAVKNQFCALLRSVIQGQPITSSARADIGLDVFITTWK